MTSALESAAFQEAHRDFVFSSEDAALVAIRENGVADFNRLGLPTRKHEAWRYTNLKALEKSVFRVVSGQGTQEQGESLTGLDAYKVRLCDGVLGPTI